MVVVVVFMIFGIIEEVIRNFFMLKSLPSLSLVFFGSCLCVSILKKFTVFLISFVLFSRPLDVVITVLLFTS